MKKFLSLVLLIMTTSCTKFNQKEKFVNPLFYQEMRPGDAKEIWNVEITPTSYTTTDTLTGDVYKESYEL